MEMNVLLQQFQGRTPAILGSENFAKFAVLLPLIEIEGETHILFEVRSYEMRRQPGEVCFPGGKFDPEDENERFTAIRETSEELGIAPSDIHSIFPLDFMLSPFGTIIFPFAGVLPAADQLKPNPDEVAEVFTVPLDYLLSAVPDCHHIHFKVEPEEGFPFDLIIGGEDYNWQTRKMDEYFYFYENRIIWGLTARILKHFLDMIKKAGIGIKPSLPLDKS
ncbi:NUDIX domain-containing protein [Bacillus aerolatus]|uniref:NUDIX domain-containing protein n=1 Tax=Bacillus aerolatus TaxID=2653354 RepID=A0A6I1FU89_9BACI|nr:CoA pyrophosphatase [Bacillus aerolatus]KAB7706133.1 NUDIX domain-containing protein [Bacillus aerolatus]